MRVDVTGVFGDAPALLAGQLSEQPRKNRPARRRVSIRGNLAAIRPSNLSVSARRRSDSAL
jgi:hypothetical protein